MEKYKCQICLKEHAVCYNTDSPLPNGLSSIQQNELDGRVEKLAESAFIVDGKKIIIKGSLQIETDFSDLLIEHLVWTEISNEEFAKKFEQLKLGNQIELKGILLSELPFFEKSVNLQTKLTLDMSNIIGRLTVESESEIRSDQQSPISTNRFIQMMQRINHPELWKDKSNFDIPFMDRLEKVLDLAKSEYISKNINFVIDINSPRENLFQVVSSEILATPTNRGIGLHLSNDSINLNYKEIKAKMSDLCESNSINMLIWDDIETYQKSYQIGEKQLYLDLEIIITKVFEENIEEIELDIFQP